MNTRAHRLWLALFVSAEGCSASTQGPPEPPGPDPISPHAQPDAPVPDAGCDDCVNFPSQCQPDALCVVRVDFDHRGVLRALTGAGPGDVWISGSQGTLLHWDGISWSRIDEAREFVLQSLVALSNGQLWALQSAASYFSGGSIPMSGLVHGLSAIAPGVTSWAPLFLTFDFNLEVNSTIVSAWGDDNTDYIWAVIDGGATNGDALGYGALKNGLFRFKRSAGTSSALKELTACSISDIREHGCSPFAVHGFGDSVWAVGERGGTRRFTSAQSNAPEGTDYDSRTDLALYGVWALAEEDVWAVGARGVVRHFDLTSKPLWASRDVPDVGYNNLQSVWARNNSDVWVVGHGASVFHYDGNTWSRVPVAGLEGQRPALLAIRGFGERIYAVGEGVILSLGGM